MRMITREIIRTKVTGLAILTDSEEVDVIDIYLEGKKEKEDIKLPITEVENVMMVKIHKIEHERKLYGMHVDYFRKHAQELDPETRKPTNIDTDKEIKGE